ncbi:uncharacterized protein LOC133779500 [Humulus lupulus]|uniref:uncharacterized protein LOC133779500 n=1 Tax=Humulus lupulus TaxID=3486 RepID=UPI002B411BA0|nr:uncharacterized protein LOC133779500 [Humulus lupulus]
MYSLNEAFIHFVQHSFILKSKVRACKAHAQEARDAQLRVEDNLKNARLQIEVRDAEIKRIPELESKLEATLKKVETRDFKIRRIRELNVKLEEEKKMTFEVIEGEKAFLLEEFKTKKDPTVDMALYQIWANNPDLDMSFLADRETEFITKWQARLEEEEARLDAE